MVTLHIETTTDGRKVKSWNFTMIVRTHTVLMSGRERDNIHDALLLAEDAVERGYPFKVFLSGPVLACDYARNFITPMTSLIHVTSVAHG